MAIYANIDIHKPVKIRADFRGIGPEYNWLEIEFETDDHPLRIGVFYDNYSPLAAKLRSVADAINAAFPKDDKPVKPAPEPETDPDDIDF